MQFYANTQYTEDKFYNEDQLQEACFLWFHNNPDLLQHRQMLYHNNNKSKNAVEGNKHRNMGVVAGVADLTLVLLNSVVFIELKFCPHPDRRLLTGKHLPQQQSFEAKVLLRGHRYYLVNSFAAFQQLVLALLA